MFPKMRFEDFVRTSPPGEISILFIRETGCPHCEHAEEEMKKEAFFGSAPGIRFFETTIEDEPKLPSQLGLVGVPAFYKIDASGRKRVKTGFQSNDSLKAFIQQS